MYNRCYLIVILIGLILIPGVVLAAAPFFEGKTIRIVVGSSAGGGFDAYSRAIAQHMGKYIPGKPIIIVENMPGAGGVIAANTVYKIAKPDGLTIGNVMGSHFLDQVLGRSVIEFDARKFEYIGIPQVSHSCVLFMKKSGITSFEKWVAAKVPAKLGGNSPGQVPDNSARILKYVLGLPIDLVSGYKGSAMIRLAAEGGEVDGTILSWSSIKVTYQTALETGDAVVVLQLTPKSHPELTHIPLAINYVKTDEGRRLLSMIPTCSKIVMPYFLPPNTPKDRIQTLRNAFMETFKDKEFVLGAEKAKMEISPGTGEDLEKEILGLFNLDAAFKAKLNKIFYD